MQPAFSRFSITVAEYGGIKLLRMFDAHVVLIPFVQKRSFCAMGIPASGKLDELLSKASAFFREFSSFNVMKALRCLFSSISLYTS